MKNFIIKNHYFITKSNQITINKKDRSVVECIGFCKTKEELKAVIKKAVTDCIETELQEGIIYWCFTHKFFAEVLSNNPSIKVLIELKSIRKIRDVSFLTKYWECEKCNICKRKACYIPYYANSDSNLPVRRNYLIVFTKRFF